MVERDRGDPVPLAASWPEDPLTAASVVATEALPIEAQTPPAVDVTFELDAVTGFTYVDASDRIVVVGGNEVLIFDRDGALLHRVTGIEGALGAEEWRTSIVVIAHATNELVVIDTATGAITRRVQAGAVNVTSVAVAGDWAWFTHEASHGAPMYEYS